MSIKNISVLSVFLLCNLLFTVHADDKSFDPFANIRTEPLAVALFDIAKSARRDVNDATQRYSALNIKNIANLSVEFKVANILTQIAIAHANNDYAKANTLINSLATFANKYEAKWISSTYLERLALNKMRQGKYLQSTKFATQAITLAKQLDYQLIEANARMSRGVSFSKLSQSGKALKDYIKAHAYFQKIGDVDKLVTIYTNQVTLYLDRFEYAQALTMSDNAISTIAMMPSPPVGLVAANYINRAIALAYLGKKDEELEAYLTAQDYALKANDLEIQASIYANISDYFLRYKNYNLAIERAKRCVEIASQINQVNLVAICSLNHGLASIHNGNIEQGFILLANAHTLANKEGMKSTMLDVYTAYADAYKMTGQHQKANEWLERRHEALLTKARLDREQDFNAHEEIFGALIEERESMHQSLKSSMTTKFLNQQNIMEKLWLGLILSVLLLVIAIFIIFRLKKRINKTRQ
ncbi:hypothetical protein [Thalassotalea sediminis]|uniref:hypothetical protein n=1 Tax=Thalassotalea sediminis TaxID=1759089 RepID=UPI0025748BD1|nr:hypothetical protein [Thalassotalea sediminis]